MLSAENNNTCSAGLRRHELGAKEGFVKGEIGGASNHEVGCGEFEETCGNEAFEGRGFEELGFRGG
jgi:hypothetical protein